MPVTPELPSSWYETKNIHLCTIKDFEQLCIDQNIKIKDKVFLNSNGDSGILASINQIYLQLKGLFT